MGQPAGAAVDEDMRAQYRERYRGAESALARAVSAVRERERAERALAALKSEAQGAAERLGQDPLALALRADGVPAAPRRKVTSRPELPSARPAPTQEQVERVLMGRLRDGEWHMAADVAIAGVSESQLGDIAEASTGIDVATSDSGEVMWRLTPQVPDYGDSPLGRVMQALYLSLPASAGGIAEAAGVDEATARTLIGRLIDAGLMERAGRRRDATGRLKTVYRAAEGAA